jgi:hypothetical protein
MFDESLVVGTDLFRADGLTDEGAFIYLLNGLCTWKHNFLVLHQFFQGCEAICKDGTATMTGTLSGMVLLGTQKVGYR